jgi:uncharacterized protein (TIGR02678 family)
VADAVLSDHLADERSAAVRALLASPLLDTTAEPDAFRLVVRHAQWLVDYFETTCGWTLTVDPTSGFARLAKRPAALDTTRPLRRSRGDAAPFDRRRYQLLCLVCAELVRHPYTTVGLLAAAVTADAGLDTSRHRERTAFVDALRALMAWGALRATAGEVDAFVDSERANALLTADTARLHRLLVAGTAPTALAGGAGGDAVRVTGTAPTALAGRDTRVTGGDAARVTGSAPTALAGDTRVTGGDAARVDVEYAIARLLDEPRYGDPAGGGDAGADTRHRWARHRLGRRLLDDPVAHLDDLSPAERDYLATPSGRRWVRDRVTEAGFELEERAEGLLAVDPDGIATDRQFPSPMGHAHQLALLLVDRLVTVGPEGARRPGRLGPAELRAEVDAVLARFPGWARGQRHGDGPDRLAAEAVELLVSFGLARRHPDGTVEARPALARYRVGEPIVTSAPTLFEEAP